MVLKLPDSGSWIDTLFEDWPSAASTADACVVSDVTEAQLAEALDAMARGDIEFVILEDGDAFIQAAGQGDGLYAINYKPAHDDGLQAVPGGVSGEAMRAALLSYRRGDGRWHVAHRWLPLEF